LLLVKPLLQSTAKIDAEKRMAAPAVFPESAIELGWDRPAQTCNHNLLN
jgi:hypothetical protein